MCTLARDAVQKRDVRAEFTLVDAHSAEGMSLRATHNLDTEKSAYVIEGDSVKEKSDMALYVLGHFGWLERTVARIGKLLPRTFRDWVYSIIARNRKFFNRNL